MVCPVLCSLLCLVLVPSAVLAQQQAATAYAPIPTPCPSTPLVRESANRLSSGESQYISSRRGDVVPRAWLDYVDFLSSRHSDFPSDVRELLSSQSTQPNLGIAVSGGGYRAALFGAGVLDAIDGRNANGLGGLLQASSYLTGLSGGSWLVLSFAHAELPRLPNLTQIWRADEDLLLPKGVDPVTYALDAIGETEGKHGAGFPVTFADVWSRALSRHFVNSSDILDPNALHGAGVTLSGLMQLPTFQQHRQPFPIVVADVLSGNTTGSVTIPPNIVPLTNTIFEFNPFEFGSFDPMLNAFTPTEFLGSTSNSCVTRFDQLSFVQGTSSNLFNEFNISAAVLANSSIGPLIALLEEIIPQSGVELDTAMIPDPFHPSSNPNETSFLRLVDGGEDGEVDPLQPLLVHARDVDVIFAVDAPADNADNFAEGLSLIASQERASLFPASYSFPVVPNDTSTFLAHNLTRRPTFFGCHATPSSSSSSRIPPLIIYLANGGAPLGQTPVTNAPTLQTTYTIAQIEAFLSQTQDIATQGIPVQNANGSLTKDPEWPVCLACGIVERSRAKMSSGPRRSAACERCLQRYCFS
ncbi:lysophospholipase [Panus rudis PR-1116 ss-1]|nr:lysophospholipase [Panus rudis PR-1116 ss-1]